MLDAKLIAQLDIVAHEHAQEMRPDAIGQEHEAIANELLRGGVLIALWQEATEHFGSMTVH